VLRNNGYGIIDKYVANADGGLTILRQQDCEEILKVVHFLPDAMSMKKVAKSPRKLVATVPNIFIVQWAKEAGVRPYSREFHEVLQKKLKDPEFSRLRLQYPQRSVYR